MTYTRYVAAMSLIAFLSGCAAQIDPALAKQHQLQVQKMQTAVFSTSDRTLLTRSIIMTMQDLSFIINSADVEKGIVSAKKFGDYPIAMTVTIQAISTQQILVRAIAQHKLKDIEAPALYEQFFSSLQKSLPSSSRAGD